MGTKISISLADVSMRIESKKTIYDWIDRVVESEKKATGEISIILCSDEFLLEMNKKFLQHDYYTDIITFDYTDGKTISGELYISIDRVRDNAQGLNLGFKEELHRVIIHGVLHLCGYGDKTDGEATQMRKKEDEKLLMLKM